MQTPQTGFISMTVCPYGVVEWLNLGITEFICGIRTREDAAARIKLCLNDMTDEKAFEMVDTNGVFIVRDEKIYAKPGTRK